MFGSGCSLLSKNAPDPNQLNGNNATVSTSVPTNAAVVGRIFKGLPAGVTLTSTNFSMAITDELRDLGVPVVHVIEANVEERDASVAGLAVAHQGPDP